jgi:hypothetical protein
MPVRLVAGHLELCRSCATWWSHTQCVAGAVCLDRVVEPAAAFASLLDVCHMSVCSKVLLFRCAAHQPDCQAAYPSCSWCIGDYCSAARRQLVHHFATDLEVDVPQVAYSERQHGVKNGGSRPAMPTTLWAQQPLVLTLVPI